MSRFIATLPMYDWPERRGEVDAEWARIRDSLRAAGVEAPEQLTRDVSEYDGWRSPDLLLGQTCWGPMDSGISDYVQVIAQPSYDGIEGGQGENYSSAIIARRSQAGGISTDVAPGDKMSLPLEMLRGKRFAYNNPDSMSGLIGLKRDLQSIGESLDIFAERIETGGHRMSVRTVAGDEADIAVIDCRSWALARRHEADAVSRLRVIGWTSQRKGLPYITAKSTPPEVVTALKAALAG